MRRFGAHTGTKGGLHQAVFQAAQMRCDCVQLFTSSPKQWKAAPLTPEALRLFRRAVEATGLFPLVAHDSYLINLASPDDALLEKSRAAFLAEMQRAEALGLDYLVTHLGSHTGSGEDAGLSRLAESINVLHEQTPGFRVQIALETTAGKGTNLGGKFEQFGTVWAQVSEPERLRVCVDTCHIFDAGYDIRTPEAAGATLADFDQTVGLDKICCVHANDSAKGLGSKADRHANIGAGFIGEGGFAAFLSHPLLPQNIPVLVETPSENEGHTIDIWKLRQIAESAANP